MMMTEPAGNPASGGLARFQDAFARALLTPDAEPDAQVAALAAQPAFAVYRNTVMKGCVDALHANYPAVARLVGADWLRAAAAAYARASLPTDPTLMRYGADFADFLARFEAAAGLPYLPGVARLDRYWTEAHAAADESALDPAALAALNPEVLASTVLHTHAAARWAWFCDAPVYTIWSRNRGDEMHDAPLDWKPEGALITRPCGAVTWTELNAAGYAFVDTCAAGHTIAAAADAALAAQSDVDFAQLMSGLLAAGAFSRMSSNSGYGS